MDRLCDRCLQLLQDFVNFIRRVSSGLVQQIKQCLLQLSECCCCRRRKFDVRQLYRPVLEQHEKEAAQEFLRHIETGFETSPPSTESLESLRTLAFSENPDLQQSAALYYLHMSQHLNTQLPEEYLEPYHCLLQSSDLEVQQTSSLSLVNFLLEGNVNKEAVVQMGLLEPILELLESGDSIVQCNSCACIMTLAVSESNREAIGSAGGIIPLMALAKSYDPRVQQNAVGALLNLTRSERIQHVLCREGALPVLTLLLQSPDSEVQYYSCAALSKIAANSEHHKAMLQVGDRFLLRMLLSLLSSSVDKVSIQSCVCLRNLATNGDTQTDLIAMNILPLLLALLDSNNKEVQKSSIALLWIFSQHPLNKGALMCEELLQSLRSLLLTQTPNPLLTGHIAQIIENLNLPENIQAIIKTKCFEGLLQAFLSAENEEESLVCVTSCIAELTKHELVQSQLVERMDIPLLRRMMGLASQGHHPELSFQAASIIRQLALHEKMMSLLKCEMEAVQHYLMNFLKHQELRFQQLGISTVCTLSEDMEFSSAISQSPLAEQLNRVRQQTEETQKLLNVAISHTDGLH
ncbi:vacuolar protein 8 [Microcaecilia unicolor]|uniref:Vacuolar protein 8 n=1 Tax=Microcaecilia unicolor TaxID=1415580 RepID=A0A6P7XUM1_9AMPH|nr:vacuolar protein 8-like [Microcaecilia unicolor]XP_030054365.1 vacuolar protein 8-like [Microcaecilia unicolor]